MTKQIDNQRALNFIKFFPSRTKKVKIKSGFTLVGIGSNQGDYVKIYKKLFVYLQKHPHTNVVKTSPIYKNPPFGYADQNDFHNAVMLVRTTLSPNQFLRLLLHTEKIFGRKRSFKNAPRTLDLDIIFFEKLFVYNESLSIPHPKWRERESVLVPMMFMNGRFTSI
jgi:2-amino-4-hydroxy-6-hydroxymethyldihydropteridine diphosphokinase